MRNKNTRVKNSFSKSFSKTELKQSSKLNSIDNKRNIFSDVGNNIIAGLSVGTGSAIAHNVIDRAFSSKKEDNERVTCKVLLNEYDKCNKESLDCKDILDRMIQLKC